MKFRDLLLQAIKALALNKMRTALATLGIVIGIGSVIALISLGQASQKSVANQIQSLGANLLTIMPGAQRNGGVRTAAGSDTTLTYADALAISQSPQVTDIINVSPELSRRGQVIAGKNNTNTQIMGATPAYADVHKVNITTGNFITQRDMDALANVAVLGPTAATDLFGEGNDPVGQTIRLNGQIFKVVGVTQSKGGSGFQNPDDMIFVPLTTAQTKVYGLDYVNDISVEAKSQDVMTDAENQIGYLLLQRHNLKDPTQADFSILSQTDILGAANQITGTLTALLSGIAAISLIVGGIGIMNIMLVTVTERTREIGLRKALGAKKKLIINQFLIEAIILTLTGGVIGILLGVLVSFVLSSIIKLPFTIAIHSVVLSIVVSGGIGILFGWYPAKKASDLQPIEALRYE